MHQEKAEESANDTNKIRLQVYIARCGIASRRVAEELITAGRVSVNGKVIRTQGFKIDGSEKIYFDGKEVFPEEEMRYILLNKPAGFVCTLADEKDRPTAASLLKKSYNERLYNIGRLDMLSEGAIIFTNDGKFSATVEHPSSQIEKEYEVITIREFPDLVLEKFLRGVRIEGIFYKAVRAERISKNKMHIVLIEGKNREIRRVLKFFKVGIKRLIRLRIGKIEIANLKPGEHRELTQAEIEFLTKN